MNKFVILLVCLVGMTAAGILDPFRMLPQSLEMKDRDQIGQDRILSMSQDELLRQKFLLDILMHVQQPLINGELLRLGEELIIDPQRYLNRLDDETLNFIELYRTQRVLGQQDTYSIMNEDHLRQMIGLYRMLVNSRDWDTFQRNVCFARCHINGVLLVNSLLLAVRDREDTRMLIMPAIYEILPELFYDESVVRKTQQLDINLLNAETRRPGLLDLISIGRRRQLLQRSGLGTDTLLDRSQLWMPWREMRMELSMRRANGESINTLLRNEDKLVLPVERRMDIGGDREMSLLTDDIGLNGFLYNLINDLVLNEQQILRENNIDRMERVDEDNNQIIGRVKLERSENLLSDRDRLMISGRRTEVDDRSIDSMNDRLLRVGRRRMLNRLDLDLDDDRMMARENRIVGGRRVVERENRLMRNNQNLNVQRSDELDLPLTSVNDERLLRINRRRMNGMNQGDRFLNIVRGDRINDGRRILGRNSNTNIDEDRRKLLNNDRLMENVNELMLQRDRLVDDDRMTGRDMKRDRVQLKQRDQLNMIDGDRRLNRDMRMEDMNDLPTRRIDDERLVHNNRRRLDIEMMEKDDEDMLMMRNNRRNMIGEGRNRNDRNPQMVDQRDMRNNRNRNDMQSKRVNVDDERQQIVDDRIMVDDLPLRDDRRGIYDQRISANERRRMEENQQRTNINNMGLRQDDERRRIVEDRRRLNEDQQQRNNIDNVGFRTTTIDDERLVHVNRRRLSQDMIDQPENFLEMVQRGIRDGSRILEGESDSNRQQDRNNIDDERILKINNRRRMGMTFDDTRRRDEMLENQQLVQMNLLRGMEDIGDERSGMDRDRRMKLEQRRMGMDADDRMMGLRQRIVNDDVMQSRQMDIDDQDRPLVTGRRRLIDINDGDATDRLVNMRQRIPRSLRNDIMNSDQTNVQRLRGGELLLHNLQQLMARIDVERISLQLTDLDLGDIDEQRQRLNNPRLVEDSSTGERWALRLNDMRLDTRRNRILLQRINDIEQRLLMVIERELQGISIRDQRDIDRIIGNILIGRIQGTTGILQIMREMSQETIDVQDVNTNSRLNIITMMRDPIMQYLLRRIVRIVDIQRQQLGAYRRDEIALDGVRINDVVVDRLRTYIDNNDADLINLLDQRMMLQRDQMQQKMLVARQQRLNHKSFNINIDLTADREQRVVVRTILIPKIDAADRIMPLDESRLNAILLDATVVDLRAGQNVIKRRSRDINWTARDTTPLTLIYQRVMRAIDAKLDNVIPMELVVGNSYRFPHRLLLPRGRVDGLPMQLLVVVTPVSNIDRELQQNILDRNIMYGIGVGRINMDRLPLGFPLDRKISNVDQLLELPNLLMKDVMIFHDDKIKIDML